jgi:nicotinamide-nucleotide amidase
MTDESLYALSESVGKALVERKLILVVAESCTGGGLSEAITRVPGSSEWFERGFVTYSNQAKQEMLGVRSETLERFGAVSEETAGEMVGGAMANSHADIALSVSGIAGPGGGTEAKPVGTVCIAWGMHQRSVTARTFDFPGNRQEIRRRTIEEALQGLLSLLKL